MRAASFASSPAAAARLFSSALGDRNAREPDQGPSTPTKAARTRARTSIRTTLDTYGHLNVDDLRAPRSLGLRSRREWIAWTKSAERPLNIPCKPEDTYAFYWCAFLDCLGYKRVKWLPFYRASDGAGPRAGIVSPVLSDRVWRVFERDAQCAVDMGAAPLSSGGPKRGGCDSALTPLHPPGEVDPLGEALPEPGGGRAPPVLFAPAAGHRAGPHLRRRG